MPGPFGPLKYLYIGSDHFEDDLAYHRDVLGAQLVWNFFAFDAHVAAFRLGEGPLVLLADHRPPRTCIPLFIVEDAKETARTLKKRGWKPTAGPFGIPDGPCYTFQDPTGNLYGFFQDDRPDVLEQEYRQEQQAKRKS